MEIVGMIITVPGFALLFLGITRSSNKRLQDRGLSTSDELYEEELTVESAGTQNAENKVSNDDK